jgi:tetratricopeptide (TPR) repeat protein
MIVVLTPAAVESKNVMDEISFALDEEKTIIPLIMEACRVPFRLRRVQHIDFQSDYGGGLRSLTAALVTEHQSGRNARATEPLGSNERQAEATSASDIQPKLQDAYAYHKRGATWHRKGDYDRAISDYSEAIKLKPNFPDAFFTRGMAWDEKGEYDRAISDYTEAIKLKPNHAEAFNNRGDAWHGKGDYGRAISDYNNAIELKPNYADAFFNRGLALSHKNDNDRAIADLRRAYALFGPNHPSQKLALAQLQKLGVNQP